MPKRKSTQKIKTLKHDEASRKNIPTAEYQGVLEDDDRHPVQVAYERRNRDLDPQLVWRGKDAQDSAELIAQAPPLFIQEKVHPKALIDDLRRRSKETEEDEATAQADLFADFNGLPSEDARTEFYQHDANWSNRMILGDSLQAMASLAEREGLRGKVQCIYIDPPYGIKFNSNFQWSTTSRNVKDGAAEHITREPEQVKAFRDTWRDGIHSYLTYLRDRLTVARDLLTESGSVFVQIGDENVHRVRALMDEVFGEENFVSIIPFRKTSAQTTGTLAPVVDFLIWYAKSRDRMKYRGLWTEKVETTELGTFRWIETEDGTCRRLSTVELREGTTADDGRRFRAADITSQTGGDSSRFDLSFEGREFSPSTTRGWSTSQQGLERLSRANKLLALPRVLAYKRFKNWFPVQPLTNIWQDTVIGTFTQKTYVVQTSELTVSRCILMATDPGDLVLDPTCGSGTTAYVAEQWGRRWITIDTSRVALALARARIMGARYPWYLLADSREGQIKEAALARKAPSEKPTYNNIRHGFVYERVPHITLKAIANNAEIDVIWEQKQPEVEAALDGFNAVMQRDARSYRKNHIQEDSHTHTHTHTQNFSSPRAAGRVAA